MDFKAIKKELRDLRAEMKSLGIKKTSPFNGGMDRKTQRYNERRFALETKLKSAMDAHYAAAEASERILHTPLGEP